MIINCSNLWYPEKDTCANSIIVPTLNCMFFGFNVYFRVLWYLTWLRCKLFKNLCRKLSYSVDRYHFASNQLSTFYDRFPKNISFSENEIAYGKTSDHIEIDISAFSESNKSILVHTSTAFVCLMEGTQLNLQFSMQ